MFRNDVKVLTFCRLAGMVEGHIPPAGWRFFLQMLHCIKALQEDAWRTLTQVCTALYKLVFSVKAEPVSWFDHMQHS